MHKLSQLHKILTHNQLLHNIDTVLHNYKDIAVKHNIITHLFPSHILPLIRSQATHNKHVIQQWAPILANVHTEHSKLSLLDIVIIDILIKPIAKDILYNSTQLFLHDSTHSYATILEECQQQAPENKVIRQFVEAELIPGLRNSLKDNPVFVQNHKSIDSLILPWVHLFEIIDDTVIGLDELYESVTEKLSNCILESWDGESPWPKSAIRTWKNILPPSNISAILEESIYPVLSSKMQSFVINPSNQELGDFQLFITWSEVIPVSKTVKILSAHFFKKWFNILNIWIKHSPDFKELGEWYLGWKSQFPSGLLNVPTIAEQFIRCLQILDRICDEIPYANIYDTCLLRLDSLSINPSATLPTEPVKQFILEESTMKMEELIEELAQKNGIDFLPNTKRGFVNGKPVFTFGSMSIYLEKDSIRCLDSSGKWNSVTVEKLLELAKN
jgi:tuftelin-interacting protein 11